MHADTKRLLHALLSLFRHALGLHIVKNEHVDRRRPALIDAIAALDNTEGVRRNGNCNDLRIVNHCRAVIRTRIDPALGMAGGAPHAPPLQSVSKWPSKGR